MKTFPQTELDFADAITDGLRRADTVYYPIGELDLCEYLRRYGWVTIKSVFPGDGRHEGRIFLQRGPNFVFYTDKVFSQWYKTLNPDDND